MQIQPENLELPNVLHRILVADDDPVLCELMQAKLTGKNIAVFCAENGAAAWEKLRNSSFDLAIIDLNMPELNGFELIRNLRQTPRTTDLPVIVATSRNDDDAIHKSFSVGATSFVTKPINWSLLHHQVRFVLRSGQVERELRQARMSADFANRTKDNLFQLLGHELRTPLNVLVGFADVLQAELKETLKAEQKEHLINMTDAALRLNSIVGDVLTYSRLFAGTGFAAADECQIAELIEDSTVMTKTTAQQHGVRLVSELPLHPVSVHCDRRQLLDALHRLIDNAIKFSPKGSIIETSVMQRRDRSLDISVRDNGSGIAPERLQECLKPFFQADMSSTRVAEGLGLGLAIVKKICELHDGQLRIESSTAAGTTATIRLPPSRVNENPLAHSA